MEKVITCEIVAEYRKIQGKSQIEVAKGIGVDKAAYSRYESRKGNLTTKQLRDVFKYLGIPMKYRLPERRVVTYPADMLDRLETTINECETTNNYSENRESWEKLSKITNEVLNHRDALIEFDYDLDYDDPEMAFLSVGTTILNVELDPRGEELIDRAFEKQRALRKALMPS